MSNTKKLTLENDGWLSVKGFASGRQVALFNMRLNPKESQELVNHSLDGFNWGYSGSGPAQLALAIMLEMEDKEEAVGLYQDFKDAIVAQLPSTSFDVKIDYERWLGIMREYNKNGRDYSGYVHAYEFIKFRIRVNYFSKFLDLPNMGYASASFAPDTNEYQLIKKMSPEELFEYKEYLSAMTMVKVPQEGKNKPISTHATLIIAEDRIIIKDMLGTGVHDGHKLSLWEK